ncbi:MAG: glycosyltransferase family 87 protein [Alphaproteobacteria bacterium]|nr:glycosyltransferase family 87 protein [Alphaproteobacteria bacterium]
MVGVAVACLVLSVAYLSLWQDNRDGLKHRIGRDFINIWTASWLIERQRGLEIFDAERFQAAGRRIMGPASPAAVWSGPPHALLLTLHLTNLRYAGAFLVWSAAGLLLFLAAARQFWPSWPLLLALLAAPSTFANLLLGQNGFFTAALCLAGFALLRPRPIVAGLLFGLLSFEPYLVPLIPVALVAGRHWLTIAATAVGAMAVIGTSIGLFGIEAWQRYLDTTLPRQLGLLAEAGGPEPSLATSYLMAGRLLGLPPGLGLAVQAMIAMAAAILVYRVFRGRADWRLRVSVLLVAALVASPLAASHDLAYATVALGCLTTLAVADGWRRGEMLTAAVAWTLPIAAMLFNALGAPLSPLVLTALLLYLARRALLDGPAPGPEDAGHGIAETTPGRLPDH